MSDTFKELHRTQVSPFTFYIERLKALYDSAVAYNDADICADVYEEVSDVLDRLEYDRDQLALDDADDLCQTLRNEYGATL